MKKDKENDEKVIDSQKNFVPLQKEHIETSSYGTENHRRSEADAGAGSAYQRHERLGLRAVSERGRPSLDNRWDTLVYEEGLPSERDDDLLGNPQLALRAEADRLIAVARENGDFIPSAVWETFGDRSDIDSGESIVFMDEKHGRVVKFKDPFAYAALKDENPYNALYEHHIHNHFFGDAPYRFLGVSQDPVSGRVRFAFEQPFIRAYDKPTRDEIDTWFARHGFRLTDDGFFYSDGYVSFTDVWGDNCFKDPDGNLRFIDPVVKFDREPKEVISHYIEKTNKLKVDLDRAGIGVGTRFRIDRLCSDNDREIVAIDYGKEEVVLREYNPSACHSGKPFTWSVKGLLEEIRLTNAYRWVQIDGNRNDVVVPAARKAVIDRLGQPISKGRLTDDQITALAHYRSLFSENTPDKDVFSALISSMRKDFGRELIGEVSIDDLKEELEDLSGGIRREEPGLGLKV